MLPVEEHRVEKLMNLYFVVCSECLLIPKDINPDYIELKESTAHMYKSCMGIKLVGYKIHHCSEPY